ncbi:hypothetical protein, partial [Priestia megaterium]
STLITPPFLSSTETVASRLSAVSISISYTKRLFSWSIFVSLSVPLLLFQAVFIALSHAIAGETL